VWTLLGKYIWKNYCKEKLEGIGSITSQTYRIKEWKEKEII
jgi:hypothetical protein